MEIRYVAFDKKMFKTEKDCLKHEKRIRELKYVFDKLVEEKFFESYKTTCSYFKDLGKPTKNDWRWDIRGYVRIYGRMGNGDIQIRFKLRGYRLIILSYDCDEGDVKYLGSVDVSKYLSLTNSRFYKIKELLAQ